MMEATQEELDRFMSYVDILPNGCWFWTGGRSRGKGNRKWYGSFWFRGKSIRAHKFSADYIGKFTPLPKGHHRDHTCVFSMCVNPDHLEHTTPQANQERKVERQQVRFVAPIDERTSHLAPDLERGVWQPEEPMQLPLQRVRCILDPAWERLKALGLWPFDEPDYSEPVGATTVGYGC